MFLLDRNTLHSKDVIAFIIFIGAVYIIVQVVEHNQFLLLSERHWAKRSELARELLSTVIWDFRTTQYPRNYWFFSIWSLEHKLFIFEHIIDIRDEPGWPCRKPLWCVISLSVQKIQILNFESMWILVLKLSYQFLNRKSFSVFEMYRFTWSPFLHFFIHFLV